MFATLLVGQKSNINNHCMLEMKVIILWFFSMWNWNALYFLFQWKAALPHLADLDFYVKECTDAGINEVSIRGHLGTF